MPSPQLKQEDRGDITIIGFPTGTVLDTPTIQKVGQDLFDVIDKAGRKKVVVDFDDIRFMSSQALGVLLTLRRKAERAGATLILARVQDKLRRVFEITNLDKMFAFCQSTDEAVSQLSAGTPGDAPSGNAAGA